MYHSMQIEKELAQLNDGLEATSAAKPPADGAKKRERSKSKNEVALEVHLPQSARSARPPVAVVAAALCYAALGSAVPCLSRRSSRS